MTTYSSRESENDNINMDNTVARVREYSTTETWTIQ